MKNSCIRTEVISDEVLFKVCPKRTLHERWSSETSEEEDPRCHCDGCKKSRRYWWNNSIDIVEFNSKKHRKLRREEKILKLKEESKNRMVRSQRPKKCPTCGFSPVGEILWGMPDMSLELQASIKAGETIIGGCCLSLDDPTWECSKCGQQIWKPIPEEELIGGDY